MKKWFIVLFAVLLFFSCSQKPRTLTVVGKGELKKQADYVILTFSIETLNKDAKISQSENMEQSSKLINRLKNDNIDEKHIYSLHYSLQPEYTWVKETQVFKGYRSINQLCVKITHLSDYKNILVHMFESGVNKIDNIVFGIDNFEALENESLLKATEDAYAKAESLSKKMNSKLGKVLLADQVTCDNTQPILREKRAQKNFETEDSSEQFQQIISSGDRSIVSKMMIVYELK